MASRDLLSSILDESGLNAEVEVIDLTEDSPDEFCNAENIPQDANIPEENDANQVRRTIDDFLLRNVRDYNSETASSPELEILSVGPPQNIYKNNLNPQSMPTSFPPLNSVNNSNNAKQTLKTIQDWLIKDSAENYNSEINSTSPDVEILSVRPPQNIYKNVINPPIMPSFLPPLNSVNNSTNNFTLPPPSHHRLYKEQKLFKKGKRRRGTRFRNSSFQPRWPNYQVPNSSSFSVPFMNTTPVLPNLYTENPPFVSTSQNQGSSSSAMTYNWNPMFNPLLTNETSFYQNPVINNKIPTLETEDQDEEEELGHAETYADYMPSKLRVGIKHPDPVVETSSLSSVPPPDVWYRLSIPEEIIDSGQLSALQLEAITYACQQHDKFLPDGRRAGFLIGDGAGVGKGRTLAGIIYENYLLGRKKAIWLSVSSDLKYDSERDLSDIGAKKIKVYPLNKFKYSKISSTSNGSVKKGVIFSTYSSLISESQSGSKYKTRLKQLLGWCGDDFDGCIVFDECHKAKNLCPIGSKKPTKTGLIVLELQNKLPKARVVYASATGASEPKNMAYMNRLGIWGKGTPFEEFNDFISVVERRGVGAMELVAMDMKLRGLYIARQLSFSGVTFKIEEIPLPQDFTNMYNKSADLWVETREKFAEAAELQDVDQKTKQTMWRQFWASHQRFFKYLCIAAKVPHVVQLAREAVKYGKCVVIGLQSTGEARTLEQLEEQGGELHDFVSSAKGVLQSLIEKHFPAPDQTKILKVLNSISSNFTQSECNKSYCTSSIPTTSSYKCQRNVTQNIKLHDKISLSDKSSSDKQDSDFEHCILIDNDIEENESTGFSSESNESDFNPFANELPGECPWTMTRVEIKNQKRKKIKKKLPRSKCSKLTPSHDVMEKVLQMKAVLLSKLEDLSNSLPSNTLDKLIDSLGGPTSIAEMTGRKGRVVSNNGAIKYESRSESDISLETLNMAEKQRFMDGEKLIAIISEAASSGISLQSDRRAKNRARRVHMTLELPWSADRAIQQFGRTHRSNQVNAPEYVFLISDLAGERRFASIVAKRLESLGALTHGDRRATETRDLSMFNFNTKYGRNALEQTMRVVAGHELPTIPPPTDYQGNFFLDVQKALSGVGILNQNVLTKTVILDKDYNNMGKFLNRILGIHVELQNKLFKYFTDTLNEIIQQEKKVGRYDLGILDLGSGGAAVKRIKCNSFVRAHTTGMAKTELNTVLVERGLSWEAALEMWSELVDEDEDFYLSLQARNKRKTAILAVLDVSSSNVGRTDKYFRIYRPNMGLVPKRETLSDIKSKYQKSTKLEVEQHWKENYDASKTQCSHMYWFNQCRRKLLNVDCEIGLRQRTYYVLSGSVLAVWPKIESVLSESPTSNYAKLQVIRLITTDDVRIVGCLIPNYAVEQLISVLSEDANNVTADEFD